MSGITSEQIAKMKDIMSKVQSRAISQMFSHPVDPVADNCPDYPEIVKTPMDLGTINQKIDENKYNSVNEWKNDVDLVWNNSLAYNKNNQTLVMITTELQDLFNELSMFISDDPYGDWCSKLINLREQLKMATKCFEIGASSGKSTKGPNSKSSTKAKEKVGKSAKSKKKLPVKKLSKGVITKLVKQINSITDENIILALYEVIEEEESYMQPTGDIVEFNPSTLKPSTLVALKAKLDSLLPQSQA